MVIWSRQRPHAIIEKASLIAPGRGEEPMPRKIATKTTPTPEATMPEVVPQEAPMIDVAAVEVAMPEAAPEATIVRGRDNRRGFRDF